MCVCVSPLQTLVNIIFLFYTSPVLKICWKEKKINKKASGLEELPTQENDYTVKLEGSTINSWVLQVQFSPRHSIEVLLILCSWHDFREAVNNRM